VGILSRCSEPEIGSLVVKTVSILVIDLLARL
jgi:hypothetical protein